MDWYFVEIKVFKEVEKIFYEYGIIIMIGLFGCGKMLVVVYLILM